MNNFSSQINTIRERIKNSKFEDGGFTIEDTHIASGSNLHTNRYYYVKQFLQNQVNCNLLLPIVLDKLERIGLQSNFTIVGYRSYTSLLLSAIQYKYANSNVNYTIVDYDSDGFYWEKRDELKEKVIILVPISATCSTYLKIRKFVLNYIKKNIEKSKVYVLDESILLFLILDSRLNNPLPFFVENINDNTQKELYQSFNWTEIGKDFVAIRNTSESDFKVSYIIDLSSELYLPERCPLCFPDDIVKEKPFVPTHSGYETPNLIYGYPNFNLLPNNELFLDKFLNKFEDKEIHMHGQISIKKSVYRNFIFGDSFYESNRESILEELGKKLANLITTNSGNVVFLTPKSEYRSQFLEELTLRYLGKINVTILYFEPSNDFIDNIISIYSKLIIKDDTLIIYFEDVLSTGKKFKLISDYIKHSRFPNHQTIGIRGFDAIVTLVDRTSKYTKNELLKKLLTTDVYHKMQAYQVKSDQLNLIFSFATLNVPVLFSSHLGNPLTKRVEDHKLLLNSSNLDSTRQYIRRLIEKSKPIDIYRKDEVVLSDIRSYIFPFRMDYSKFHNYLYTYKHFFDLKRWNLFILTLSHNINSFLGEYANKENPSNQDEIVTLLVDYFEKEKIFEKLFQLESIPIEQRDLESEANVLLFQLLKLLSRHPFIYYQNIYFPLFKFIVKRIDNKLDKFLNTNRITYEDFEELRFLVARSIDINSNAIFSRKFFDFVLKFYSNPAYKEEIMNEVNNLKENLDGLNLQECNYCKNVVKYREKQIAEFTNFLIYGYKYLMHKHPIRSVILEKVLNSKDFLPAYFFGKSKNSNVVIELMQDPYFQFTGRLKFENTKMLNDFLRFHDYNISQGRISEIHSLWKYYFKYKKHDPTIRNTKKMIFNSRYNPELNSLNKKSLFVEIKNSYGIALKSIKNFADNNKLARKVESQELTFNDDMSNIVKELVNILLSGKKDSEVNYHFVVKHRNGSHHPGNYYSVSSSLKDDQIQLDNEGLLYNFLEGLYADKEYKEVQSVLSLVNFDKIGTHSFQEHYYITGDQTPKSIKDLLRFDHYNASTGNGILDLDNCTHFVLLRFSDIAPMSEAPMEGLNNSLKAILLITSNRMIDLDNYLSFFNNEKLRLIMLMRDYLLKYLNLQFSSKVFNDFVENIKLQQYQKSLNHGITDYLSKLIMITNKNLEYLVSSDLKNNFRLTSILLNAIKRQITDRQNFSSTREKLSYTREEIFDLFCIIFESVYIKFKYKFSMVKLTGFNEANYRLYPILIETIFPEIIINMKKNGYRTGNNMYEIECTNSVFYFRNKVLGEFKKVKTKKKGGGLEMCKNILQNKKIGMLDYDYFPSENTFVVSITLI